MAAVFLLGLTGGIGSGKSTVAQMLGARGAAVIDADAISRRMTAPGGAAISPLSSAFGPELITDEGALNRERMRALVFSDPQARQRLEAIVHPLIAEETDRQKQKAIAHGAKMIIFDVPLLVESGDRWRRKVDRVLVVDCPAKTQIARAAARSGLAREEVEKIIANQASGAARRRAADLVIYNDGLSLVQLQDEVSELATHFGL